MSPEYYNLVIEYLTSSHPQTTWVRFNNTPIPESSNNHPQCVIVPPWFIPYHQITHRKQTFSTNKSHQGNSFISFWDRAHLQHGIIQSIITLSDPRYFFSKYFIFVQRLEVDQHYFSDWPWLNVRKITGQGNLLCITQDDIDSHYASYIFSNPPIHFLIGLKPTLPHPVE